MAMKAPQQHGGVGAAGFRLEALGLKMTRGGSSVASESGSSPHRWKTLTIGDFAGD